MSLLLLAVLPLSPNWSATLYVSPDGDGTDGLTWETAFQKVGDAIVTAASGDDLWIREGSYFESIELRDGLSLYGGFKGIESPTEFEIRDPERNLTSLNATGTGSRVAAIIGNTDVLLDGLEITGGMGVSQGAGVHIENSTLITITRCNIHGNRTCCDGFTFGGGIDCLGAKLTLTHSTIVANEADEGCGIHLFKATAEIRNCTMSLNRGRLGGRGISGGGLWCGVSSVVLDDCHITDHPFMAEGGGLLLVASVADIRDCSISRNVAGDGAGIFNISLDTELIIDDLVLPPTIPVVSNCVLNGNIADGQLPGGGGINSSGPITIQDCTVTNNTGGYNGGGIYTDGGPVQIRRCLIEGNQAREGGGISTGSVSSEDLISDSVIRFNTAERSGGGIATRGSGLFIDNCEITRNTAQAVGRGEGGGGIIARHIQLISESTISGNRTGGLGGGIRAVGRCNLQNCLVFDNSAQFHGGGFSTINYEPLIQNCLFANNTAVMPGQELFVGRTNDLIQKVEPVFSNCIIWNVTGEDIIYESNGAHPLFRYCDIRGGWEGEGNIDSDPLFVDTERGKFQLEPTSPCIDTASTSGPDMDFEGNPRPVDVLGRGTEGPGAFDMGAFEFQIPLGDLNSNGQFEPLDLFLFQRDWLKATDVGG